MFRSDTRRGLQQRMIVTHRRLCLDYELGDGPFFVALFDRLNIIQIFFFVVVVGILVLLAVLLRIFRCLFQCVILFLIQ